MPAGGLPRAAAAAAAQAAPDARLPPAAATAAGEPLPLHLAGLSEEQLAAATAPAAAPLRVVAGPGSGKTRVLAARAAHLIHAHGARPWQVAAITFTNKAADELRARLAGALGEAAGRELFAGTFHSLCYRLLRRGLGEGGVAAAGRAEGWSLLDADASVAAVAALVRADDPSLKGPAVREEAKAAAAGISRVKNALPGWPGLSGAEAVDAFYAATRGAPAATPGERAAAAALALWFDRYEAALRAANAFDFDDLLGVTVAALRRDPEARARLRRRLRHVLVDEFQDTNAAQYELVRLLAAPAPGEADAEAAAAAAGAPPPPPRSLFVVGDPEQAIYGFRGADVRNMRDRFARDFPGGALAPLRDNWRSAPPILAAAAAVIGRGGGDAGGGERGGALRARAPAGPAVRIIETADAFEEADRVAAEVSALIFAGGRREEEVAVLVRTHAQARPIEAALLKAGVRYVLVGGMPFWRRAEVQDAIAYLRLALAPDALALDRIINVPKRGLGPASVEKLAAAAAAAGAPLAAFLFGSEVGPPPLPPAKALGLSAKAYTAVEELRGAVAAGRAALSALPLGEALEAALAAARYEEHVAAGGCGGKEGDEGERLGRLRQLAATAAAHRPGALGGAAALDAALDRADDDDAAASPPPASALDAGPPATPDGRRAAARAFLDEACLYTGLEEGADAPGVRLSTIHAAKGLEFDSVFVPGVVEGLLPLYTEGVSPPGELEEETRLFFVAATRARRDLTLLHSREFVTHGAANRRKNVRSRFLEDVIASGAAAVEAPGGGAARRRGGARYGDTSGGGAASGGGGGGAYAPRVPPRRGGPAQDKQSARTARR